MRYVNSYHYLCSAFGKQNSALAVANGWTQVDGGRLRQITLNGKLQGVGQTEDCLVLATKVSLRGTNQYEYAKLSIHRAPDDLPDGTYTVTYVRRTSQVIKQGKLWLNGTW
jgi:hypothetical protein